MKKIIACCSLLLALGACGGTTVIDTNNERQVAGMTHVMELEFRDWENTAELMTKSMIASGVLPAGNRTVIAIGRVTNDTMQRFDTDILVKKIRSTLISSGRVQVTTALPTGGVAEDMTTHNVRDLRENAEWNTGTIAQTGTLVAPTMSLSGKMIQRNFQLRTCWLCSSKERVEYYLQLTLTEVKTGLSVWEQVEPIVKEGRNAPTW